METTAAAGLALGGRESLKSRADSKALALQQLNAKPNQVGTVLLYGVPIVSLVIEATERLCLAQISNTLLKTFSYNEIHNRRVALGITCVQCTPVQLEILRRAGAMPVSSRRCGMITRREAERLCKSFLGDNAPPRLPDDFAFSVHHECAWGCRGAFLPARYNSSRAKCIKCSYCGLFFSPNKFIFHSHRVGPGDKYVQPDAANFNSWRRHMKLSGAPPEEVVHAWEDVKAMFNGGTRKRMLSGARYSRSSHSLQSDHAPEPSKRPALEASPPEPLPYGGAASAASLPPGGTRVPAFPDVMSRGLVVDYMWPPHRLPLPYALPWLKRGLWTPSALTALSGGGGDCEPRAFRPVRRASTASPPSPASPPRSTSASPGSPATPATLPRADLSDESVDVETTEDERPRRQECYSSSDSAAGAAGAASAARWPDSPALVPKLEQEECEPEPVSPPLKHGIRALTHPSPPPPARDIYRHSAPAARPWSPLDLQRPRYLHQPTPNIGGEAEGCVACAAPHVPPLLH